MNITHDKSNSGEFAFFSVPQWQLGSNFESGPIMSHLLIEIYIIYITVHQCYLKQMRL